LKDERGIRSFLCATVTEKEPTLPEQVAEKKKGGMTRRKDESQGKRVIRPHHRKTTGERKRKKSARRIIGLAQSGAANREEA